MPDAHYPDRNPRPIPLIRAMNPNAFRCGEWGKSLALSSSHLKTCPAARALAHPAPASASVLNSSTAPAITGRLRTRARTSSSLARRLPDAETVIVSVSVFVSVLAKGDLT